MKNVFFTERQQHLVIVRSRIRRLNFMRSTAERVNLIRLYETYGILGPFRNHKFSRVYNSYCDKKLQFTIIRSLKTFYYLATKFY